jgi:alpha-ketoglutarate-dependent taurine dioxygenase
MSPFVLEARPTAGSKSSADTDSGRVLRLLHRQINDPEVQVRWRWATGDVAIWDEMSTCDRALTDHAPQGRTMRRCRTKGGRPISAGG